MPRNSEHRFRLNLTVCFVTVWKFSGLPLLYESQRTLRLFTLSFEGERYLFLFVIPQLR